MDTPDFTFPADYRAVNVRNGGGSARLVLQGSDVSGISIIDTSAGPDQKHFGITSHSGQMKFWDCVDDVFSCGAIMTLNEGGNVGIGTAPTDARLHVAGGNFRLDAAGETGPRDFMLRVSGAGPDFDTLFVIAESAPESEEFPGFIMALHADGNVGIGVAPAYALDVGGDIHATGDILSDGTTVAPDYVFDPNYPLMPLAELAVYVGRERHLPDIPDGPEVAEHGVNLTELQMQLLRKIEELTLYSIAQHRQVEVLEALVEAARERSDGLSRRNEELAAQHRALDRRLDEETRARRAVEARLAALEGRLGNVR
jgi:hypothetical protein